MDQAAKPTTGQIAATAGMTLARGATKWVCAFLAIHGVMLSGSQTETVVGIVFGILTEGWSLWNSYGKDIATAGLVILRARVLNAAAKAQRNPAAAPAALAAVAAHVEAPATPPVPNPTAATFVALIGAGLTLALLAPGAAYAQGGPRVLQPTPRVSAPAPAPRTDLGLPCDPAHLLPGCSLTSPGNDPKPDDLWQKITGAALVDLKYAKALSDAVATPGALARGECWAALIKANEDANGVNLKNADGTPMTKPTPDLFTSVEQLGEVIDNLAPTGPVFLGCSKAATMLKMSVLQFINGAVGGAAGLAALGVT